MFTSGFRLCRGRTRITPRACPEYIWDGAHGGAGWPISTSAIVNGRWLPEHRAYNTGYDRCAGKERLPSGTGPGRPAGMQIPAIQMRADNTTGDLPWVRYGIRFSRHDEYADTENQITPHNPWNRAGKPTRQKRTGKGFFARGRLPRQRFVENPGRNAGGIARGAGPSPGIRVTGMIPHPATRFSGRSPAPGADAGVQDCRYRKTIAGKSRATVFSELFSTTHTRIIYIGVK